MCNTLNVIYRLPRWLRNRLHLPMQEMPQMILDQEDPLEEETATQSSILVWETPRAEGPGGPQPTGLQRIRYDLATELTHIIAPNT